MTKYIFYLYQTLLLFFSGLAVSSCTSEDAINEEKGIVNFKNVNFHELPEENRKMVVIYQDTFLQAIPDRFYYLNSLRAQKYAEIEKSVSGNQRIQFLFNYASELLYSGKMEECRAKLYELINVLQFEKEDIQKENAQIHTLIGLSYIYQALQEEEKSNNTTFFLIKNENTISSSTLKLLQQAKVTFGNLLRKFPEDKYYNWINNLLDSWLNNRPISRGNSAIENTGNLQFIDSANQKGINHKGMIGGICVADFNKDGYYDIISGSIGLNDALFYYEGNSNGKFKLRSKEAFLEGSIGGERIIQGDINNDGFPDVFIIRGATLSHTGRQPNSLLKNNGDGTFTDITEQAGLLDFYPGNHAHFVDYNNDGLIDIFVANESVTSYFRNANPCQLFHNNGNGTFTEVGKNYGLNISDLVKASSWFDFNNDGLLDLYVSIEGDSNRLYLNKGLNSNENKWGFEPLAQAAGATLPIRSGFTLAKDFNQDGWEDLLVFGSSPSDQTAFYLNHFIEDTISNFEPLLYLNQGDGSFQQANKNWNVNFDLMVLGGASGDIDNNGYPDIYTGTGNSHIQTFVPNSLIKNSGESLSVSKTSSGISFLNKTNSVQLVDINFDGKLDILATMGGFFEFERWNSALLINESKLTKSWIQIELEGKSANKQGIGSLIEVTTRSPDGKEIKQFHRISTNQSPSVAHIGMGQAKEIAEIKIYWPDENGSTQTLKEVEINQLIRIKQE